MAEDERHKRYRLAHKEQIRERDRQRYRRNPALHTQNAIRSNAVARAKFLQMYGVKCACCGETMEEFLTIEHKLGQTGVRKKESASAAYRKAVQDYRPDLYEVLCMNCNHSKGVRGYCPHQLV